MLQHDTEYAEPKTGFEYKVRFTYDNGWYASWCAKSIDEDELAEAVHAINRNDLPFNSMDDAADYAHTAIMEEGIEIAAWKMRDAARSWRFAPSKN